MFGKSITWTCHVCQREREDQMISVYKEDISESMGLPAGSCQRNVRYCADSDDCYRGAIDLVQQEVARHRGIDTTPTE